MVSLPESTIEVSADEDSGKGTVVYDSPGWSPRGRIEGLTLQVENGRIARYSASSGQDIFDHYIKQLDGDVDRFAFFGFGLNPGLRHGFTQDDKVLGGVTIGFGNNEDKQGRNRAPADWWGSIRRSTVHIGERLVMKDGNLLI